MAREPDELVEMRRVLGAQLAAYRQAAELSQGQLAIAAMVDRTTVAHIEKGRSRADERFWTIADEKCRAEGSLLDGFRAWEAAKQAHEVRAREAQLAEARARAEELRAPLVARLCPEAAGLEGAEARMRIAPGDGAALGHEVVEQLACSSWVGSLAEDVPAAALDEVVEQLARLLGEWIRAMNRRQLIQLLGWTGTITVPTIATILHNDEQERLARAIATPSRVDEKVIGHIETILQDCKRQEDALGSRAVLETMLAQRDLVTNLLAECPSELRSRLLSVYSDMSTSLGFYLFDLGRFDDANGYWDQARAAAKDANNIEFGIYALGNMCYSASWQGKGHTAIDLAASAQSLTRKTDDPLMHVCAATEAALAYATNGEHAEFMTAFEKAEDILESIKVARPESPAYWYHEGWLISRKSECLLRLGKPREAVLSASEGLALFDRSLVGSQAFCVLRLGNARLQSGEIDEAARLVGEAAGQTRSTRLVKELRNTRTRMQPWRDTPAVRALDDQLETYGLVGVLPDGG